MVAELWIKISLSSECIETTLESFKEHFGIQGFIKITFLHIYIFFIFTAFKFCRHRIWFIAYHLMCAYSFNCFYKQMYLYFAIQSLFLIWSLFVINYCSLSIHPVFIHQAFQKHYLFNISCVPLTFSLHALRDRSGPPSVSYDKQLSDLTRYKPNTGELVLLEAGIHCFWLCVFKS